MTAVLSLVLPALLAFLIAGLFTPAVRRLAFRVGAIDVPDARKVHREPIARLGGLAVVAGIILSLLAIQTVPFFENRVLPPELLAGLILGLLPVFAISLIDDIRPLGALPKFGMHLLGAGIAVSLGVRLNPDVHLFGNQLEIGWIAIPLSIVWIAGVTNAFNIVDGLDGLAGGLALISSISLGAVSMAVGKYEMAATAFVIAGALAGFLPYNFHPASIFLGDAGSASVGFLLGCLALRGGSSLNAGMAVLVPLVVLGLPLAETLVSMARRGLQRLEGAEGAKVFGADRRHFHHRLLDKGLDHGKVVLTLYGVGVLLALCGFASILLTYTYAALLLGALVIAAFIGVRQLGYDEFQLVRRGTVLRVYDAPVLRTAGFVVFIDLLLAIGAIYAAIVLKWDDWGIVANRELARDMMVAFPPIAVLVFWSFGLYRGAWKVASIEDFTRSSIAAVVASIAGALAMYVGVGVGAPVSFWILYTMTLMLFTNGMRASYRLLANWNARSRTEGIPVLIYGAGKAGLLALREMQASADRGLRAIGFVDDDPSLAGRVINGYPVYGSFDEVEPLIARGEAGGVVISTAKVSREKMLTIRKRCDELQVPVRYFSVRFNDERESKG